MNYKRDLCSARLRGLVGCGLAVALAVGCNTAPEATSAGAPAEPAPATKKAPTAKKAPVPTASEIAKADQPDQADQPLHKNPGPKLAALHKKGPSAPPPTAKREGTPEVITTEHAILTVGDITVAGGEQAVATIELRPNTGWMLNTEYPIRVVLAGSAVASPARIRFSSKDASHGMMVTSGGMRLDIPFVGQAPGSDHVEATIRFGVCSTTTCAARKSTASFRVDVPAG